MAIPVGGVRPALAALALAGSLAACGGPAAERAERTAPSQAAGPATAAADAPSAAPSASAREPNIPLTDLVALTGEYRVAGVGGRDIDLPHAITARIDDTGMIVESGCVQLSWAWFFEGSRLVTEQLFPRASCGRALLAEEEAIVAAMNGATAVGRTSANGIEFAGENGALLLFSQ